MGVPLYACVRELCLVLVWHFRERVCSCASAGGATASRLVSVISQCTALTCRGAMFEGLFGTCTHSDVSCSV